ncbi:MAG: hypothetical protein JJE53_02895 [Candidatus Pacebacteria bacterium]|nr:hypothetical protein [Candidatus Paceibacterota bacterium]
MSWSGPSSSLIRGPEEKKLFSDCQNEYKIILLAHGMSPWGDFGKSSVESHVSHFVK